MTQTRRHPSEETVVALIATLGLMAGLLAPATTAAAVSARAGAGCLDDIPIEKKPYFGKPFRYGKTIHFGIGEWHNPPSCDGEMRRSWVKVYKVKKGKDPKVYATTAEAPDEKRFAKGTYRVKVRYQYRYWSESKGSYTKWRNLDRNKTLRIR